jgi:PAS domain S-box-containing protein
MTRTIQPSTPAETLLAMASREPSAFMWKTDTALGVEHLAGGILPVIELQLSSLLAQFSLAELFQRHVREDKSLAAAHHAALAGEPAACEFAWGGSRLCGHIVARQDSRGRVVGCLGFARQPAESKRLESALEESDRKFWQIIESAPDAMVITNRLGNIVMVNEQTQRLFGFSRRELLNQPVEILVPERFRETHTAQRTEFCRFPTTRLMSERPALWGRRKDGTEFPAEIVLSPIDTENEVLIAAAVRDVTHRQVTEAALRTHLQIQATLIALLELSLQPMSLQEQMERVLDCLLDVPWIELESKGAVYLVQEGTSELTMIAQRRLSAGVLNACQHIPFGQCLCGAAAASRRIVFTPSVDERHPIHYEGMRPHGHYCVPILSGDDVLGVINLYVAHGHQRTDTEDQFLEAVAHVLAGIITRNKIEASLRISEERFELAVNGTDAGIWDWNLVTNQVHFSPRWKSILGYGPDEIADHVSEWETRLHPDDRIRSLATVKDYLEGRTPEYELEHRLRHRDGGYRWILARGAAVRDASGTLCRMVGSSLDISQRKQDEEMLRQREAQLIAAQRIQEFILPHRAPQVPGFDIAGKVLPAEFAGGDYFDFLRLPDGAMGIVVGDVSGHDVSAALIMASASAHLRSFAEDHHDVEEILFHTNAILSRETDDARFVTLFFLRLDPHTRQISYVNAGHPSAYVLSHSGDVKHVLHSNSFPLSVLPDTAYPLSDVLELAPGDIVLLVTDGILEARSPTGEFFDADHLLAVLRDNCHRSAAEIIDCVFAAIHQFTACLRTQDDLTAVVVKVNESPA